MNALYRSFRRGVFGPAPSPLAFSASIVLVLTAIGCSGDRASGGNPATGKTTSEGTKQAAANIDGEKLYRYKCASCHLSDGKGIPGQFPPLDGSEIALGDPVVPIRIVLHGLSGPLVVKGTSYDGLMPGWSTQLSAAEIAAVLSYVRSEWGSAPQITAAEVEQVKTTDAGRTRPWTVEELGIRH